MLLLIICGLVRLVTGLIISGGLGKIQDTMLERCSSQGDEARQACIATHRATQVYETYDNTRTMMVILLPMAGVAAAAAKGG